MMDVVRKRKLCRMLVVNKIDAPDIDFGALMNELRETFGGECLPVNLPVIREHLGMKAPEPATETPVERIARVYSIDLHACPGCAAGKLEPFGMLQPRPARGPPPE